jgi:uncharacterized membrane protein
LNRPKIDKHKDKSDHIIDLIGLLALAGLLILPLLYFWDLPGTIPQHYGMNGTPDAFGSKGIIWLLPIIGSIMYSGLTVLNRYPYTFNFPVRITEKNALRQYTIATKLVRSLKAFVACLFCYLNYSTIQIAMGKQSGLGLGFLFILFTVMFWGIGFYIYWAYKNR